MITSYDPSNKCSNIGSVNKQIAPYKRFANLPDGSNTLKSLKQL